MDDAPKNQRSSSTHNDGQNLEGFHRKHFNHPNDSTWRTIRSLAQPSFLKPVKTYGDSRTESTSVLTPDSRK